MAGKYSLPSFLSLLFFCFLTAACGGPEPVTLSGENIISFGDSLTFGTGAPRDKSYPAQPYGWFDFFYKKIFLENMYGMKYSQLSLYYNVAF